MNLEWVSVAVGCGPLVPRDLSEALSRVGLRHREVPMFERTCLGKRGRESDEQEPIGVYPVRGTKKRYCRGGRLTPGSNGLLEGLLAQSIEEDMNRMDFQIPMFGQ